MSLRTASAWLLALLLTGCAAPQLTERSAWAHLQSARDWGSNYHPINRDALVRLCVLDYLARVREIRSPHTPAKAIESEAWVYFEGDEKEPMRIALPGVEFTRALPIKGVRFRLAGHGRLVCLLGGIHSFYECGDLYLLNGDTASPAILSRWVIPYID